MSKKRALILTNYVGFVSFLWNDIKLLTELGYDIHFAAYNPSNINENELTKLKANQVLFINIPFDCKKPFSKINISAFRKIWTLLKKNQYDLIHCHTPIVGFLTRLAALQYRKNVKVLYTAHGFAFSHLSSKKIWLKYYPLEVFASFFTDIIITINREDFAVAQKMYAKEVRYINGVGVDSNKYSTVSIDRDEYRKMIGVGKEQLMILSVGELSHRKNHQIIIKALSTLENKSRYVYVICGRSMESTGTEYLLKDLAKKEGVNLILLGFRHDIPMITHCSDIGAIPSIREGLGLVGIQSLCAGIPLVGSCVQGIKDYIIDGKTGYLNHPFDYNGFADKIKLLSDEKNRFSMKNDCIEIAKKFDNTISHKQMRDIYLSLQS